MKAHTDAADQGAQEPLCLSDEAIEEAAVLRAAKRALSAGVERHLSSCLQCSARLDAACEEAEALCSVFSTLGARSGGGCLSDEDIALYLDRAHEAPRRAAVEQHLARCISCQRRMIALYDEVQLVCAENSEIPPIPSASLAEARERFAAREAERDDSTAAREADVPSEVAQDVSLKREARQR